MLLATALALDVAVNYCYRVARKKQAGSQRDRRLYLAKTAARIAINDTNRYQRRSLRSSHSFLCARSKATHSSLQASKQTHTASSLL